MKKIVAYVGTLRVHWLVEELGKLGIREMLVMEFFKPLSRVSRFEFFCSDGQVEEVRNIIHRIGTTGMPGDHCIDVQDTDPGDIQTLFAGSLVQIIENGGCNETEIRQEQHS